jgi:hypothetical protein
LAVSVARVIWRDRLAKIEDTKIIGIDTQWYIWYNLSSVAQLLHPPQNPPSVYYYQKDIGVYTLQGFMHGYQY